MASRRRFLEIGLGACAAGAIVRPVLGHARIALYYKVVFDERFQVPCAFGAGAAARRIPTAAIRGDVTSLFFDDLDLRWKRGPALLAGYTTRASLFCLDLLARDRGMRIRHCVAQPSVEAALGVLDGAPTEHTIDIALPSGDPNLVFWIIAPSGGASSQQYI